MYLWSTRRTPIPITKERFITQVQDLVDCYFQDDVDEIVKNSMCIAAGYVATMNYYSMELAYVCIIISAKAIVDAYGDDCLSCLDAMIMTRNAIIPELEREVITTRGISLMGTLIKQ